MPRTRPQYRPIADYGLIGDCESAALVASDGSVDWWCPLRFDAPSAFAAVLDREQGGFFRVGAGARATSSSAYLPRTNVLVTRFGSNEGDLELVDFMPPQPTATRGPDAASAAPRLVRIARATRGRARVEVEFVPRFDYGRAMPRLAQVGERAFTASGAGSLLFLESTVPLAVEADAVAGEVELAAGESAAFTLSAFPIEAEVMSPLPSAGDPEALLDRTVAFWRSWADGHAYRGPYADAVMRSALVLKLLTYAPTGAVVAAPTCSLPEWVGGVRNWDYRYAWIRDAVFSVRALHIAGHGEEADAFVEWVLATVDEDPEKLRVLYPIAGGEPDERILPHLKGYRGSKPVRVGNAAHEQFQLDVYGELMEGFAAVRAFHGPGAEVRRWPYFRRLADFVAANWRRPDSGIWEVRSAPKHFVLSKAMAWVALDRAARVAEELNLPGDAPRWRAEAHACREEALDRGWSDDLGAFKQAYEAPVLDAANLLLPLVGFIDARDPRMIATTKRTREVLTVNDLVYRYLDADDGLPGTEASFAYCTFWLVEVLARQGEVAEARRVFERMLARASPLGLFAEEIDPRTGEHLGNFPQGFPHIGLINAAIELAAAERRLTPAAPGNPASRAPRPLRGA